MAILGIKSKVEIAKTYASPVTITAITKANPGVVTAAGHGYDNGDVVVLAINGMVELNGQIARVANKATDTFELESINTTSYGTFTSGTAAEITAWATAGDAQSINATQATPNRIDATTLIDDEKQYVFGLPESPEISISGLLNPTADATVTARAASRSDSPIGVRVTFRNGNILIFNAYISAGDGFEMAQGGLATTTWSLTQIRKMVWFAS